MLLARKLIGPQEKPAALVMTEHDGSVDLTNVFPRMFVRRHDPVSNRDLLGHDPHMANLAAHVNSQIREYIQNYKELRDLTEASRAYLAAVRAIRLFPAACTELPVSLLATERALAALPPVHPSELVLTIARYEHSVSKGRRALFVQGSSVNGGVSLSAGTVPRSTSKQTDITRALRVYRENAEHLQTNDLGMRFISFSLSADDPEDRRASLEPFDSWKKSTVSLLPPRHDPSINDVENEPPAQPFARTRSLFTHAAVVVIVLLTSLFLISKLRRSFR